MAGLSHYWWARVHMHDALVALSVGQTLHMQFKWTAGRKLPARAVTRI